MIISYGLEFILHTHELSDKVIKSYLCEFGENLNITDCSLAVGKGRNLRICLRTQDPAAIFDICAQFGRIKSVKIDEGGDNG